MAETLQTKAINQKNQNIIKAICIAFLGAGMIINWVLPFCWGNNPFDTYGTLSLLCEHRKGWFWLWSVLVYGGSFINIRYMYRKFDCKSKLLDVLNALMLISAAGVALSLDHSIETWNAKRIIHWIVTITLIVFLGASLLVFVLKNIKKQKAFIVLTAAVVAIIGVVALWFLVIGRSGMMEIVPNTLVMIFLFVVNFTPAVKKKF